MPQHLYLMFYQIYTGFKLNLKWKQSKVWSPLIILAPGGAGIQGHPPQQTFLSAWATGDFLQNKQNDHKFDKIARLFCFFFFLSRLKKRLNQSWENTNMILLYPAPDFEPIFKNSNLPRQASSKSWVMSTQLVLLFSIFSGTLSCHPESSSSTAAFITMMPVTWRLVWDRGECFGRNSIFRTT